MDQIEGSNFVYELRLKIDLGNAPGDAQSRLGEANCVVDEIGHVCMCMCEYACTCMCVCVGVLSRNEM